MKECLLEVQRVYLNQLTAEENHVTGVAEILGVQTIDLKKNHRREAERVIDKLWSSERSLNPHVDRVNSICITDTKAE